MSKKSSFTNWAVIASGQGGGRVACRILGYGGFPGTEDRILIMNTNIADITNMLEQVNNSSIQTDKIAKQHVIDFGPKDGSGNLFHLGEENIRQDEDRVIEQIEAAEFDGADAFLYLTSLGGGTGCGSVPYLINSLQEHPPSDALKDTTHVAFAAWPYEHEGGQRHFSAVGGLSRLLNWDGTSQTADVVLLASNTHLRRTVAEDISPSVPDSGLKSHQDVNGAIIKAMEILIEAGRETYGVTDVIDIMAVLAQQNIRHVAPGLALDFTPEAHLPLAFDTAAENIFLPVDPTTAEGVIAVVRASRREVEQGRFDEYSVGKKLGEWLESNDYDQNRTIQKTLVPSDKITNGYEVLLLFAGVDIKPMIEDSMSKFKQHIESSTFPMAPFDSPDKKYSRSDFRRIKQNLEDYLSE